MKFRFSLEQVWKWRKHLLHEAEQRYLEARRTREAQEAQILEIETRITHLTRQAQPASETRLDYIKRLSSARLAAQRQLARALKELEQLQRQEARAREQLIQQQQALETIEKLREKEWERFQSRMQKAEAHVLDEAALSQFIRNSRA